MRQKVVVQIHGVAVEVGKTMPKELDAMGLMVDYNHAQQRTEWPFFLNCGVYYGSRHVGEIGFDSGREKLTRQQIRKLPITRVMLDAPSLGFLVNDMDFAGLTLTQTLNLLGSTARHNKIRHEFTEVSRRCGDHKIFLIFENEAAPSCVTVTTPKTLLPWITFPWEK